MKILPIKLDSVNIFPAKNLQGKYCLSPFVQVNIDPEGRVGICGCSSWQPTSIGNIFEHTLQELLAGYAATHIRQSIIDGTYIYCHPTRCGILRQNQLNEYDTLPPEIKWAVENASRFLIPHHIVLAMDRTCNLSCPSCRTQIVKNNEYDKDKQQKLSQIVSKHLFSEPTDKRIELTLDPTGELFASPFLLNFLNNIRSSDFPNLQLDILSNGLLAEQRWNRMGEMQNHVKKITITYDAARADTYERLRRGGTWQDIMSAMTWLKNKKSENGMEFHARMVVQRDNYQQMMEFYELSKAFNCDTVQFQKLLNWGTFTAEEFAELDVCNAESDLHQDLLHELEKVINLPDALFWHSMPKNS